MTPGKSEFAYHSIGPWKCPACDTMLTIRDIDRGLAILIVGPLREVIVAGCAEHFEDPDAPGYKSAMKKLADASEVALRKPT